MTTSNWIVEDCVYLILSQDSLRGNCQWIWKPNHPADVLLRLTVPDGEIDWHFGRQILIDAMIDTDPVGNGDVQACLVSPKSFQVYLESPEGAAILAFPADVVKKFLKDTLTHTSVEQENYEDHLEIFLADLFGTGTLVTTDPDDTQPIDLGDV